MYLYSLIIYWLLFSSHFETEKHSIYIAKNDWHVGIILEINDNLISKLNVIKEFESFNYVDIGWGDAEFYQSPGDFDLFLAAKAVLLPTPSVIRIQGYNSTLEQIINWRDYTFRIELTNIQYDKLCSFINNSFKRDSDDRLIITSEKHDGKVKFFSSKYNYHIAYTCNTWVAEALEFSGLDVKASNVVTAENLMGELAKCGTML